MNSLPARILIAIGSSASIGFGIWHFFVPKDWKWYSYIDARATELIIAVRAINIFFSLALVLGATCILWFTRVLMQIISPQGSMSPALQYSMLSSFVAIFLCYALPLILVLARKNFIN